MTRSTFRKPKAAKSRLGITRVGLLVLLAVIVLGLGLLIPAIDMAREAGRRANCLCQGHQFGLSMQNYASTYGNSFPSSAAIYTDPTGHRTVGGYSAIVKLLPFMEYASLYDSFRKAGPHADLDAAMSGNAGLAKAMNTPLPELIYPSNPNTRSKIPIPARPNSRSRISNL